MKTTLIALSSLVFGAVSSNAATFIVSNVVNGPGDTLYASSTNVPLASGYVGIGFFVDTITVNDIDSVTKLHTVLSNPANYTMVASAVPGFAANQLGDGYADGLGVNFGTISAVSNSALLGRTVFSIATNQLSLADFAAAALSPSNQIALVSHGPILSDVPDARLYGSNPQGTAQFIVGTLGSLNTSTELGAGTYGTLKLAAVPEPSAALLGALGALGLLRRRRN